MPLTRLATARLAAALYPEAGFRGQREQALADLMATPVAMVPLAAQIIAAVKNLTLGCPIAILGHSPLMMAKAVQKMFALIQIGYFESPASLLSTSVFSFV